MEVVKTRRAEYAETTRAALLDAACTLFVADGYHAVGLEAVARDARVTRGAFYHHFADKTELFAALVERLQAAALEHVRAAVMAEPDPQRRLAIGCAAFLDACVEPAYRRLVIETAPSVLGAARCRAIEDRTAIGAMIDELVERHRTGRFAAPDPALAARMIAHTLCEAALLLPEADHPKTFKRDALAITMRMIAAFEPANPAG